MLRTLVLSSLIIAVGFGVNQGYKSLLAAWDVYVQAGYGRLAEMSEPELRHVGEQVLSDYRTYRHKLEQ